MNTESSLQLEVENDESVIKAELNRILCERRFSGAPQMSAFLRYIVTETLNGHADRIKAFSVGVDALGKPDTFDAQTDPSVRVLALRLRKTLATMYEELEGCHAIIELRVGTYVPLFYKAPAAKEFPFEVSNRSVMENTVSTISRNQRIGAAHLDTDNKQFDAVQTMNSAPA